MCWTRLTVYLIVVVEAACASVKVTRSGHLYTAAYRETRTAAVYNAKYYQILYSTNNNNKNKNKKKKKKKKKKNTTVYKEA